MRNSENNPENQHLMIISF